MGIHKPNRTENHGEKKNNTPHKRGYSRNGENPKKNFSALYFTTNAKVVKSFHR